MQKDLLLVMSVACVLSACFGGGGQSETGGNNRRSSNRPPTITGTPPPTILSGAMYAFTPIAADPDGDALEFRILQAPSWATFDRTTGRLTGTPDAGDVGQHANISLSVSDGHTSVALPTFGIVVNQLEQGSATLSWMPPTENADGSTLANLAGYRIYYGRSVDSLNQTVVLSNPGLTRHVVENLSRGWWHFAMTAVNGKGAESNRSGTASKQVG